MDFKKFDIFRRTLTGKLTKNIGQSKLPAGSGEVRVKRVLVSRPNHRLGNLLLITPLVQELSTRFPDCRIDLFIKGNLGPVIFKNHEQVDQIITLPRKPFDNLLKYLQQWNLLRKHKYDLVINVVGNSSSGRISTQLADSPYKLFGGEEEAPGRKQEDYTHMAKSPVYDLRKFLGSSGSAVKNAPVPTLNLKLSPSEIREGREIVDKLKTDPDKETISIFTYATGDKCYSAEWWDKFYNELKSALKDYNIIEVLPVENVSRIDFRATSFYSKDIREIGAVIANTRLFIGADSGIMHLASAAQTPTIGLFSGKKAHKYQPYGNDSLSINTNNSGTEDWIEVIQKVLNSREHLVEEERSRSPLLSKKA